MKVFVFLKYSLSKSWDKGNWAYPSTGTGATLSFCPLSTHGLTSYKIFNVRAYAIKAFPDLFVFDVSQKRVSFPQLLSQNACQFRKRL